MSQKFDHQCINFWIDASVNIPQDVIDAFCKEQHFIYGLDSEDHNFQGLKQFDEPFEACDEQTEFQEQIRTYLKMLGVETEKFRARTTSYSYIELFEEAFFDGDDEEYLEELMK